MKRSRFLQTTDGFGLIEVMIAAGIMTVVALVLAQIVVDSRNVIIAAHTRTEQDLTASFLGKIITNSTAIVNTAMAPGNDQNFKACILSTAPCQPRNAATPIDFYDATNVHVSGTGTGPIDPTLMTNANSIAIAPVYYDASLARCVPAVASGTPTCGIQVFTYYVTSCAGAGCTSATSMTIYYIMKQATGVVLAGANSPYLKPVINETVLAIPFSIGGTSNNIVSWQNASQLGGSPIWTNVTAASVAGMVGINKMIPAVELDVVGNENVSGLLNTGQLGVTGNINSNGNISALGTITGGNIVSNTNVWALGGTVTAQQLTSNGNINAAANIAAAGTVTAQQLTSNGNINAAANIAAAGTVTGAQLTSTGNINANGNISGLALNATNSVSAGTTISAGGNITGASINSTSTILATGNVTGQTVTGLNNINTNGGYIVNDVGSTLPQTALVKTSLNARGPFSIVADTLTIGMSGAGLMQMATPMQGILVSPSDERLKKDIVTISDAENKLDRLRGVMFTWKKDSRRDMGVIAQEVEKVIPEVVMTDKKGMKAVEYTNLVGILIEGYKESKKRLQAEIDDQKKENKELKERLDRLEKIVLDGKKN